MASRKEEQERRRAERLAAERRESSAERRRLMAGYLVAGVLTLAVIVGLAIVLSSSGGDGDTADSSDFPEEAHVQAQSGFDHDVPPDDREGTEPPAIAQGDLEISAKEAGCELDLDQREEGNTHVELQENFDYSGNPPASGDHFEEQQADGAWAEMPNQMYTVHSLEHGRINIQYSPELSEQDQLALKGIFDEKPEGSLFFPNDQMPYEVAATAWTQMIGCKTFEGATTLDAIRNFRDIYLGQGPEDVPIVTG
jgi:hypothetical protein